MKRLGLILAAVVLAAAAAAIAYSRPEPAKRKSSSRTSPNKIVLDLDKAVAVKVAAVGDLKPAAIRTPDGRAGWALRIPGNRPIATPAYANGMLYVGGGYGSHEFYCFDADSGQTVWQIKTKDDGPTAAVVEDGLVAFNTESCTVCVVDARTGNLVWQEWLGDPLMSQPAIANGRLYMAYPKGQRGGHGVQHGGQNQAVQQAMPNQSAQSQSIANSKNGGESGYRLLCANLRTGKHLWEQKITADVISAPIIEGDRVLLACQDGTSFSLDAATGKVMWKKHNAATSAPLLAGGRIVVSRREREGGKSFEGLQRLDEHAGKATEPGLLTRAPADYFDKGGSVALKQQAQAGLDSGVGFGGGAPAAAEIHKAKANLGVSTVAGGWAYQGSRAAYANGQILNAQGSSVNAVKGKDGKIAWKATATGRGVSADSQLFSPPALGKKNMYLVTSEGHLLAIDQAKGKPRFVYHTGQPIAFQPALARGNLYAGTTNGMLICLKTGDKDADGWYAWGGNARHNKKQ